ncbi:MAG: hypothetical protein HYV09_10375 [Deltaproteobacteria bacterium]|nr:hypothetical protein [Deltaproteobacteria bacterium]
MRALRALTLSVLVLGGAAAACVIGPKQDDPITGTPGDRDTDTGVDNETPSADTGAPSATPDAAGADDSGFGGFVDAAADAPNARDADASDADGGDAADASETPDALSDALSDTPGEGG